MSRRIKFSVLVLLLCGNAHSATIDDLPCQNGCANDCIRFNQGTVFVQTEKGAKLLHQGHIYNLSRLTSRYVKRHQKDAEVPGDIQVSTWSNGKGQINAEVTQTVKDTTCYWRKPNGSYASSDSCCGTNYRVKFKLVTPQEELTLNTTFESGC